MNACAPWALGSAADFGSTQYATSRGAIEANPLQRSLAAQIAVQSATAGVGCWGDVKLQAAGHRNWARGLRVAVLALKIGLAVHNVRAVRSNTY
jgi:hypothetical protein